MARGLLFGSLMKLVTLRSASSAFALTLLALSLAGCGHTVDAEHDDVVLDDDGVRYRGAIDFPEYWSGGGCVDDDRTEHCSATAFSIGTVRGLSVVESAEISLEKATDESVHVIVVQNAGKDGDRFVCTLHSVDITHAFECTPDAVNGAGSRASITLTPITNDGQTAVAQ